MVELQTLKVILEFAHLYAVGVHCLLLDIACLVDSIDDDLGVAIRNKSFDSEGNNDVQPMDQGLVLGTVVARLVMDLQDVLQVTALGRDEKDACTCTFEVQGTIEVHLPVL
jgi:multisubunit Na+/H+ antiporter MnhC subunit